MEPGLKISEAIILLFIVVLFGLFGYVAGSLFELTESALYQTLSAIIESLSVLLGLFGVFFVFRLEIQEREVRDARDELNVFYPMDRPDFVRERADYTPSEELLEKVETILEENPESFRNNRNHVIKRVERLGKAIDRKKRIKELMLLPLVCMAIILILSLILLPFSGVSVKHLTSPVIFSYIMILTGLSVYAITRTLGSLVKLIFE